MKNKLSMITFIIIVLICQCFAFGCSNNDKAEAAHTDRYIIQDFETMEDLRMSCNYWNEFGKAALNTDKNFVTSGEKSVRLEIHGNYSTPNNYPSFVVYSDNPYNALAKFNFTDVDRFSVDVYNDSDNILEMSMGYSYNVSPTSTHSQRTLFVLPSKQWTKLNLLVSREAIMQYYDLKAVNTFIFSFDTPAKDAAKPVVYFDNFIAHKAMAAIGEYVKTRADLEINNFDTLADVQSVFSGGIYTYFNGNAMLSHNIDARYAKSGNTSLKIQNKHFEKHPYTGYNDAPTIGFKGDTLKAIKDFSKYKSIKFSVYNDSGKDYDWSIYVTDGKLTYAAYNLLVKNGMWNTFEIEMDKIKATAGKVNGVDLTIDMQNIIGLNWAYSGISEGEDLIFYLDEVVFTNKEVA